MKAIKKFAIHCSLENIVPNNEIHVWSSNGISFFKSHVQNKILNVALKAKYDNLYNIDLYLKTQNIANLLVNEGHALRESHDQTLYLNQIQHEKNHSLKCGNQSDFKNTMAKFNQAKDIEMNDDKKTEHQVTITCIYGPYCFYAQSLKYLNEYHQFEAEFQQFCDSKMNASNEEREAILLHKPHVGQLCAAKFSQDDAWYRAVIKEIDFELRTAQVFFIDYGNEETVNLDSPSLLIIAEKFKDFPCAAIKCCLNGIRPPSNEENLVRSRTDEAVDFMFNNVGEIAFATFLGKNFDDCYLIDLKIQNPDKEDKSEEFIQLALLLVENKYAVKCETNSSAKNAKKTDSIRDLKQDFKKKVSTSSSSTSSPLEIRNYELTEPILDRNKSYEFLVTFIETLNEFYVRVVSNNQEFKTMMNDLQLFYEKKSNLPHPLLKENNACVYYDLEEKTWHRAKILKKIDSNHCLIRLVDHGEVKYVNKITLRVIHDKFVNTVPCQVILASLSDLINHKTDEIDEQINSKFRDLALNKKFLGKIIDCFDYSLANTSSNDSICSLNGIVADTKKYLLNLFDENHESVYSLLIQELNTSTNLQIDTKFRPSVRSNLEETKLSSTMDLTNTSQLNLNEFLIPQHSQPQPQQQQVQTVFPKQIRTSTARDLQCVLNDETSPFPVHEENLRYMQQRVIPPPSIVIDSGESLMATVKQISTNQVMPDQTDSQKLVLQSKTTTEIILTTEAVKPISPIPKLNNTEIKSIAQQEQKSKINFYGKSDSDLKKQKHSVSVSIFENPNSFYVQLMEDFTYFDTHYEAFQSACLQMKRVNLNEIKDLKSVENLAIAARFYDDSMWYRAKLVVNGDLKKTLSSYDDQNGEVLIEFVDYGNRQLTKVKDVVFLSEEYAKFRRCAVKCDGLAYQEAFASAFLDQKQIQNLLTSGLLNPSEPQEINNKFENCYFIKNNDGNLFIEIDTLYETLFKSNMNLNLSFDPSLYKENILKQANHKEIKNAYASIAANQQQQQQTLVRIEARLTSLDSGLDNIHFNLKSSLADIKNLEDELIKEKYLIEVKLENLQTNAYYLVKKTQQLYRVIMLTKNKAKSIDYGHIFDLKSDEDNFKFYVMLPKYFKHHSYALHCRLSVAHTIENVWTSEEKKRFYDSVQLNNNYKIRLFNTFEPYIFEYDLTNKIDFDFAKIIQRIRESNQMKPDSQALVQGTRLLFDQEEFYFGGNWLKNKPEQPLAIINPKIKHSLLTQNNAKRETFYIFSKTLLNQLDIFNRLLFDYEKQSRAATSNRSVEELKKDHFYLTRTKSEKFLSNISNVEIRNMIQSSWCRIKVTAIHYHSATSTRYISILYYDYGLEDLLDYEEHFDKTTDTTFMTYTDYQFLQMPIQFLLWPKFVYECVLDNKKLEQELKNIALNINSFIDADFINSRMSHAIGQVLNTMRLRIKLLNEECLNEFKSPPIVDIFDALTSKNLIEIIFSNCVNELNSYLFPCVVVHVNSADDFYVQKVDEASVKILDNLQSKIQFKVQENKLEPVKQAIVNKLYVAQYDEDSQYYRAKVIGIESDQKYDVFYVDFGNTSQVRLDQLREISHDDLVAPYPKSYALNCQLKVSSNQLLRSKLNEFNDFFFKVIETNKFFVKCLERKSQSKYLDTFSYKVEIIDQETKQTIIELFDLYETENPNNNNNITESMIIKTQTSCAQFTNYTNNLSTSDDDKAIAEDFIMSDYTQALNDMTEAPQKDTTVNDNDSPKANENTTWILTPANLQNYDEISNNTTQKEEESIIPNDKSSWCETASHLRDYGNYNETTLNEITLNQTNQYDNQNDDLYSTANDESLRFKDNLDPNESVILNSKNKEFVTLKECIISYMHSAQDFFIQQSDVDLELDRIQPKIDDCLDPYVLSESKFCIGQFVEDDQFYRMRVLEWRESEQEALTLLIDYGNKTVTKIDTITKMSKDLLKVKPLALNCKLINDLPFGSIEYNKLIELINLEVKFDVKIKKEDLDAFYADNERLCPIELFFSLNGKPLDHKFLQDINFMSDLIEKLQQLILNGN